MRRPCGFIKRMSHWSLLMVPMFISFVCNSTATIIHIGAVFPATDSTSGSVNPMYSQLITASFMAIRDLNSLYATDRKILFKLAVRDSTTTFEGTVAATVAIATRTFGVNRTNIIIGGGSDRETEGMSSLLKYSDIPQIYATSDLSSLEPSDYENLSRVYPPSSSEGSTLAKVLSSYFSYSRVVLIHSTDVYGLASSDKFISSAEDLGIEILLDCSIGFLADIDHCFESLKNSDARVFVLLISSLETAGAILSNGTIAGIFNQDSIIFGSGSLSTTSLWSQLSLQPLAMTKLMANFFTISFANDDWKVSIRGKSFIKNFRSQANTVVILPNGTKICSDRTDDDGHFKLFQITPHGTSQYICVGKIYSSFAVDGSDITSYTSYVYDAIWAAGIAVIKYADTFRNGIIPTNAKLFNGKKFVLENVEFPGYSGNVSFSTGKHHRGGFSHTGLRYKISNFHMKNGTLSTITLQRVGTSTEDGIFSKCTSDTELQSFVTGGCSELRYGNVYNIQPSDRAHNIIQSLPVAMRNTLYVIACIDFVVIIFFGVILVIYRHSRILRAAQPAMMWIILSSNLYLVVRIIMSSGISNSFVCVCNAWTGHLGFMGINAMFCKTLRIFIIVKSGIRKIRIGPTHVLVLMFIFYFFWVLYLTIYTIVDPPIMVIAYAEDHLTGQFTETRSCRKGMYRFDLFLVILEAGIIVATAVLCFFTREVPDAINESKAIATALSLIIVLLLVSLLSTILPSQIEVQFLFGFCFCFASIGSMIIYFGLRSWMLLSGADLNGNFEVVWDKNAAPGTSDKTNAYCSSRNSRYVRNSKSEVQVPTTADECYKQINVLKKALAAILAFEANPLNNSPSFRVSRGLNDVKKSTFNNNAGLRNGDESNRQHMGYDDDDDEHAIGNEYERQHQHNQVGKVHTETSKICPMSTSI